MSISALAPKRRRARRHWCCWSVAILMLAVLASPRVFAISDEIQVYTGDIAAPGIINVTLHNYYIAESSQPVESAAIRPDGSYTGGTEWAFGATPWFELGIYSPIYTRTDDGRWHLDGTEVRAFFVTPNADSRSFCYGLNVALELNAGDWGLHRRTLELRPVLDWRVDRWAMTLNPVIDSAFDGLSALQFSAAARVAFAVTSSWSLGVEEYSEELGTIKHPAPVRLQNQRLFAVADARVGQWMIEPGIGIGLTAEADRLTYKLIVSRDLN